jgi:hypothetical protein
VAVPTLPPTFSSLQILSIFAGRLSPQHPQYLDKRGYLRPSHYWDDAQGRLITREERDEAIKNRGRAWRGDPHRRYSYSDVARLRLLLYVRDELRAAGVGRRALQRAGQVVDRLRQRFPDGSPPARRLLVLGDAVYLLGDTRTVECLTPDRQLPLVQLFADEIESEVRGRVEVLSARVRMVAVPSCEDRVIARA